MDGPLGIPDQAGFWIDDDTPECTTDKVSTQEITIVDGHVHSSQCFEGLQGENETKSHRF